MQRAVALAADSEVAVVLAGRLSGEAMDVESLHLPGRQAEVVAAVAAANPRTVLVTLSANPVIRPEAEPAAWLHAWFPGEQFAEALADVLTGTAEPGGRLPITFPAEERRTPMESAEQYPGVDGVATYAEELLVGYRWYDARGVEPAYAFGHGLGYTTLTLDEMVVVGGRRRLSRSPWTCGTPEAGRGKAVPQVYVGYADEVGEPPRQLKAFDAVRLDVGESRYGDPRDQPGRPGRLRRSGRRPGVPSGELTFSAGLSSRDIRASSGSIRPEPTSLSRADRFWGIRSGGRWESEPWQSRSDSPAWPTSLCWPACRWERCRTSSTGPRRSPLERRHRVEAAVEQLGFVPSGLARALARGHQQVVALVVLDLNNPYFSVAARGMEDRFAPEGIMLTVASSDEDPNREKACIRLLEEHTVAGVVITPSGPSLRFLERLRSRGTPAVLLGRRPPVDEGWCAVTGDDAVGGALVARHLLELGHQRIAYLNGVGATRGTNPRRESVRSSVEAAGGKFSEVLAPTMTIAGGEIGAQQLLEAGELPNALVCANDLLALGVLRVLERQGIRVPDDLALVGYDDADFARSLSVPLTTVHHDKYLLGQQAGRAPAGRTTKREPRALRGAAWRGAHGSRLDRRPRLTSALTCRRIHHVRVSRPGPVDLGEKSSSVEFPPSGDGLRSALGPTPGAGSGQRWSGGRPAQG